MSNGYRTVKGFVDSVNTRTGEVHLSIPTLSPSVHSLHATGFIGGSTDFPNEGDTVEVSVKDSRPVSAKICDKRHRDGW